ncbi:MULTISPECIES: hypothetical protein [Pseudoalteromonas]|uniref:Uncharacterized protein n=2 Tax=Pseudoalteromonas TaxID=53246 RepID=A0A8I2H2H7_9GAMM|nr:MULTISPECIES: hypothetical protein [Pseudoalteromonas]MBD0782952.1 hypothetical protein [Pseudoalteromonas flavipulchra]MBE0374799.1 hypothetical protein [Pseudoalteromonas flavipulchra NCIMB 2033 = ATCC BAA-314]NLR21926.1 hypothetical protein [Pseudoalteromonas maricaloris]QUI65194.1 hypothetical protein GSF04_23035 [Pseudoalteromonas sp. A22]RZG13180.1 hypothetical protein EXT47_17795 [Pseudoalteromonas sp. CO342X]
MKQNTIEKTSNHTLSSREYQLIKWAYSHGYSKGQANGLDGVFISSSAIQGLLDTDLHKEFDTQNFITDLA